MGWPAGARMGLSVRAFTRQHIAAIAVGVLVAGTPLIAFNFWLSGVIDRQGQAETEAGARRMVALAESRVGEAVRALDDLAAQGAAACAPGNTKAMQRTAFVTAPIKEVSILAPDGETLCTHFNNPLVAVVGASSAAAVTLDPGERRVLSSELLDADSGYSFDVVQLADDRHMVRLRHRVGEGPNEIAALMSTSLFPAASDLRSPTGSIPTCGSKRGRAMRSARPESARRTSMRCSRPLCGLPSMDLGSRF